MSKDLINSILKGIEVLQEFDLDNKELGITELHKRLGYPKTTIQRIVNTYESIGFLTKNSDNNKYMLGMNLFTLGLNVGKTHVLRSVAEKYMKNLSEKFNETVQLSVLTDEYSVCILKVDSKQVLSAAPREGEKKLSHVSSSGKVVLAYNKDQEEKFMKDKLELLEITPYSIGSVVEFKKQLELIRNQGYSVNDEESEIGLYCIGVPIFNNKGVCSASLSISIPKYRKPDDISEMIEWMTKVSKKISLELK